MPVVVPLVAVGVAILLLLVAYALTVLVTPLVESVLREVPLIGGYLAGKVKNGVDWFAGQLIGWVNTTVHKLVEWFHALTRAWSEFVDAVNAFIVELPDKLDHLAHVTVHEIVKAFVNPVREVATAAEHDAQQALGAIDDLRTAPLDTFRGIEHGVDARLDHLRDVIANVDLPELHKLIDREIVRARDAVAGQVDDLSGYVDGAFADVWDFLGRLPMQQLLALLTAVPVLATLVQTIAAESGLDSARCRSKVKGICATDPSAWAALLDVAGLALAWVGITEFVSLAQDMARELVPEMLELVGGR